MRTLNHSVRPIPTGLRIRRISISFLALGTAIAASAVPLRVDQKLSTAVGTVSQDYLERLTPLDVTKFPTATTAPQSVQNAEWYTGRWNVSGNILSFKFSRVGFGPDTSDSNIFGCSAKDATGSFTVAGYGYEKTSTYDYLGLVGTGGFSDDDGCTDGWLGLMAELFGLPVGSQDSAIICISSDAKTLGGVFHDSGFLPHPALCRAPTIEDVFGLPEPSGITAAQVTSLSDNSLTLWGYGSTAVSQTSLMRWSSSDGGTTYTPSVLGPFAGVMAVLPSGCSSDGTFSIGSYFDASQKQHAYEYSDLGGMVDLGANAPVGSQYGQAYQCSADGSTVVGFGVSGAYGYIWKASTGISPVYPLTGLTYSVSQCMSSDGVFFGGGSYDPSFSTAAATLWTEDGHTYNLESLLSLSGLDMSSWSLRQVTSIVKNADGSYLFIGNGMHHGMAEGWVLQMAFNLTVLATQPQNATVSPGGQANFSVQTVTGGSEKKISAESAGSGGTTGGPTVADGTTYTFQWQRSRDEGTTWRKVHDGGTYSGSATSSLTINPVTTFLKNDLFRCVVSYAGAAGPITEDSNAARLTVPGNPVGDFNGDGQVDLLWSNKVTGERYLWFMTGTTYASSLALGVTPTQWRVAGRADFNGDGQTDILWQNSATGECYLWLMNGAAYSSSVYLGTIATDWQIAAAADFNGDGKPDILWRNTATGDCYIWLMNATAFSSGVDLGVITTDWQIAAAADFNGDGKTDIVWQNATTGDRYFWFMDGTAYVSGQYLANIGTQWQIVGAPDLNGDGSADLVWQNTTTGERYVWLMNGSVFSSSVLITIISTDWTIAP